MNLGEINEIEAILTRARETHPGEASVTDDLRTVADMLFREVVRLGDYMSAHVIEHKAAVPEEPKHEHRWKGIKFVEAVVPASQSPFGMRPAYTGCRVWLECACGERSIGEMPLSEEEARWALKADGEGVADIPDAFVRAFGSEPTP